MASSSGPQLDDQMVRREKYDTAREKGYELLNTLQSINQDADRVFPAMSQLYRVKEDGATSVYTDSPAESCSLQAYDVNPNHLSSCYIYSPQGVDCVCGTKNDANSGLLFVSELVRSFDENPPSKRLPMSELLWQSHRRDASNRGLPPSALRLIWLDTVVNTETQIVV